LILNFEEAGIQVLNGRYGPYISDGKTNAKIPKDKEPKSLTLEECKKLIAETPAKKGKRTVTAKKSTAAKKTTKSSAKKK
jgi:DNA topoisomerase-1